RDHFGDVESEGRAKRLADLPGRKAEDYLLELRHHRAAREKSQVSATPGTVRKLVRDLPKIGVLRELRGDLQNGCPRCRLVGALMDILDDVRRMHHFGRAELLRILLEVFSNFFPLRRKELRTEPPLEALHAERDFPLAHAVLEACGRLSARLLPCGFRPQL